MTEPTTETNAAPPKATWQDAIMASMANQQQPGDPKPKFFIEKLPCLLSDKEIVDVARRFADARNRIDEFDAETKAIASDRKAKKAKLLATAKEYEDATRTGRVMRDVRCAEFTSLAQNRRWRVRLDRK